MKMTEENIKVIEKHLSSKNLSQKIYDEILDHMISQTEETMETKQLKFELAVIQTYKSWKPDLQMVKADYLNFKRIPRILKQENDNIFTKILILVLAISVGLLILFNVFPESKVYLLICMILSYFSIAVSSLVMKKASLHQILFLGFQPIVLKVGFISIAISLISKLSTIAYLDTNIIIFTVVTTQILLLYYNNKNYKLIL